jgi:hypothetical protein
MMRIVLGVLLAIALLAPAAPALAQDGDEIIVTGMRKLDRDDDEDAAERVSPMPAMALTLRRSADFAIQQVTITGDSREEGKRREEIYAMTRTAIDLASKFGVQLATGEIVVEPLTAANYKNLTLTEDDDRSDAERVTFLVKTPLAPGVDAKTALERISKFIAAVPAVGRAEMEAVSELTLSVVNPEQYRRPIIELIAKDAASTSSVFGPGYGVEATGLDRPVQWNRASLTEVFLFLPAAYSVRPRN